MFNLGIVHEGTVPAVASRDKMHRVLLETPANDLKIFHVLVHLVEKEGYWKVLDRRITDFREGD